ncbi:MAG: glycerol-3-phosphate 1-O-acyltransferase PlsB [Gammaproteobacteria bacterium]
MRAVVRRVVRPRATGAMPVHAAGPGPEASPEERTLNLQPELVYVLEERAPSDLVVLDLIASAHSLPGPFEPLTHRGVTSPRRFFHLNSRRGLFARLAPGVAAREQARIIALLEQTTLTDADTGDRPVLLVPIAVFWGRVPRGEGSWLRLLLSEHWAITSRLKRLVNVFLSRRQIVVDFGEPVALDNLLAQHEQATSVLRRASRLLRIRIRNQRAAALGPDLSHQRTLIERVVQARPVRAMIESGSDAADCAARDRLAHRYAREIASNLSFPAVRILEQLLRWFWNRIYRGIDVTGLEPVRALALTHTLVYVPSHRSHLDYLLLSYLLYQHGLTLPHIAAGNNLNLPVVGGVLRRAGAFFMRRSFRGDALYATVFSEYLYQVYRRGHSVEFFPEGGRTRTGRLLPARLGLIKMTLEHHARGLPRPIAFVPVYFGYEKLVEAASYLSELRGSAKRSESLGDVFAAVRLIRQNFGHVDVRFGEPLVLGHWLGGRVASTEPDASTSTAALLGAELMRRINAAAVVNPVNLVALVTLCTPRLAIEAQVLEDQIAVYQRLLAPEPRARSGIRVSVATPTTVVETVIKLGLIAREDTPFGPVLHHDPVTAVLMTWYRNNVAHVLAVPSLLACLLRNRRRPLPRDVLVRFANAVLPFVAEALTSTAAEADIPLWLPRLAREGLIAESPEGYAAPPQDTAGHSRMRLLAGIVMPVLERLYIVVRLVSSNQAARQSRAVLQTYSAAVAGKVSRLQGLNAPEFFDPGLFNQFVDALLLRGLIHTDADDTLVPAPVLGEILRVANNVIDPEFRAAVQIAPRDTSSQVEVS